MAKAAVSLLLPLLIRVAMVRMAAIPAEVTAVPAAVTEETAAPAAEIVEAAVPAVTQEAETLAAVTRVAAIPAEVRPGTARTWNGRMTICNGGQFLTNWMSGSIGKSGTYPSQRCCL